jgi:hypothetical protein
MAGKQIYVTGNIEGLGNAQEPKALRLAPVGGCTCAADLAVPSIAFPFTYRYALMHVMLISWAVSCGAAHVRALGFIELARPS